MRPLLLVTGSRHLIQHGEDWCREELVKILRYLPPNAVVMHGGASGPDTWADEHATALGLATVAYLPDGRIRSKGKISQSVWSTNTKVTRESFLTRNRMLVHVAVQCLRQGPAVCVGFRSLGAPTHGTEYTLRHAREAGLWTEERVLP